MAEGQKAGVEMKAIVFDWPYCTSQITKGGLRNWEKTHGSGYSEVMS